MSTQRGIGLGTATLLVVANMIGAGVFTTSGFALADLGSPGLVLAAWVVGGGVALAGTLSYAGLARRLPESGGEYAYLRATFGPLAGFLAGWVSLLAGFTAPIAVAALALEVYIAPLVGFEVPRGSLAAATILIALGLHGLRGGAGIGVQNASVVLKLALLAGLFVAGGARADFTPRAPLADVQPGLGAFAVSLVWISFSYSGWNATVYLAGEVRDPARNAGRSLWLGCAAVTLTYLALNAVFLYSAPLAELRGRADIGLVAARALGGEAAARTLSAVVALALFTSVSAMMLAGPRVYARMAQDGLLPARFAFRGEVPLSAVALQAVLALVVVAWSDVQELLSYAGFTLGLSSAAAVLGLLRLRRREGPGAVPIPGYPLTPLVHLGVTLPASAWLVWREPRAALVGLATALSGVPVYYLFRRLNNPPPRS